jgi:hypothetical protein
MKYLRNYNTDKMKNTILILIILTLFSYQSFSQGGRHHQNRELIKQKKYEFVKNKLQLTEKEKKEFMPLYKSFDNEREKIHDERRAAMKNFKENHLNMSDEDLIKLIDTFADLEIRSAQLGKTYSDKFKKVLPPMKIILLFQAENDFKRHLLRGAHDRRGSR